MCEGWWGTRLTLLLDRFALLTCRSDLGDLSSSRTLGPSDLLEGQK